MFQDFQTTTYAGFWIRVLAYLIDTILLSVVLVPMGVVAGVLIAFSHSVEENPAAVALAGLAVRGVSLAVGWLYFAGLESSSWQASVGKKALGLTVTDLNGHRISFAKATGRYFGKILSAMILLIGFVMIAFSDQKQGLHDQLAGTLVLRGAPPELLQQPPPPPDFANRPSSLFGN